jgi:translation elongation factor EF-4
MSLKNLKSRIKRMEQSSFQANFIYVWRDYRDHNVLPEDPVAHDKIKEMTVILMQMSATMCGLKMSVKQLGIVPLIQWTIEAKEAMLSDRFDEEAMKEMKENYFNRAFDGLIEELKRLEKQGKARKSISIK